MSTITVRDYEMALMSQSACNLSGIVHSLSETVSRVWEEARAGGHGTDWVNAHPICRLYAEQIMYLSSGYGSDGSASESYSQAYQACADAVERMKAGKVEAVEA